MNGNGKVVPIDRRDQLHRDVNAGVAGAVDAAKRLGKKPCALAAEIQGDTGIPCSEVKIRHWRSKNPKFPTVPEAVALGDRTGDWKVIEFPLARRGMTLSGPRERLDARLGAIRRQMHELQLEEQALLCKNPEAA